MEKILFNIGMISMAICIIEIIVAIIYFTFKNSKIDNMQKHIIMEFVSANKDNDMRVTLTNYHNMYYSLSNKLQRKIPIESLWYDILDEMSK